MWLPRSRQWRTTWVTRFYLAKLAKSRCRSSTIVLARCGVHGRERQAPQSRIKHRPPPRARARIVPWRTWSSARRSTPRATQYGDDLAVVCYVNSTMEIKSWSDVCVTSSNAVDIVSRLPQHNILFIPDQNLGHYVAEQVPEKNVLLNKGYCPRHHVITAEQIEDARLPLTPARSCSRTPSARRRCWRRQTTSAPLPALSLMPRRARLPSSSS